jgi:hypothetical protein
MLRYCVIVPETGLVFNIVEFENTSGVPADGYTYVQNDFAQIGWEYIDGQFINPNPQPDNVVPLKQQALMELGASDTSVRRLSEAIWLGATTPEAPDVIAFLQWRKNIRLIATGVDKESTSLPEKPPYPVGT